MSMYCGSRSSAALEKEDTSDEEREWLDAVESGDIEEYEKKKAERKTTVLTARQVSIATTVLTARQVSIAMLTAHVVKNFIEELQ